MKPISLLRVNIALHLGFSLSHTAHIYIYMPASRKERKRKKKAVEAGDCTSKESAGCECF